MACVTGTWSSTETALVYVGIDLDHLSCDLISELHEQVRPTYLQLCRCCLSRRHSAATLCRHPLQSQRLELLRSSTSSS